MRGRSPFSSPTLFLFISFLLWQDRNTTSPYPGPSSEEARPPLPAQFPLRPCGRLARLEADPARAPRCAPRCRSGRRTC